MKQVYNRIYRELELHLRIKALGCIKREKLAMLQVLKGINQVWSLDFMSDNLMDGHVFGTFDMYLSCTLRA